MEVTSLFETKETKNLEDQKAEHPEAKVNGEMEIDSPWAEEQDDKEVNPTQSYKCDINIIPNDVCENEWRQPYIQFLKNQILSTHLKYRAKILRHAWKSQLIEDTLGIPHLYKIIEDFNMLFRCVSKAQGLAILEEIHSRICGNHFSGHNLTNKVMP